MNCQKKKSSLFHPQYLSSSIPQRLEKYMQVRANIYCSPDSGSYLPTTLTKLLNIHSPAGCGYELKQCIGWQTTVTDHSIQQTQAQLQNKS